MREQVREKPHHHLAVLEHVGHAARHPQIVLEHVELALPGAHHVDAGDMRVDAPRHVDAVHLGPVLRVAEHLLGGDAARPHDVLLVIDVVDEAVERAHPLLEAGFELPPLAGRDDARNHIEGDQAFGAGVVTVDREGDADAPEHEIRFRALVAHRLRTLLRQPALEFAVVPANDAARVVHLVVRAGHSAPDPSRWSRCSLATCGP